MKFFGARKSRSALGSCTWFALASLRLKPSLTLRREPAVYEGPYGF